MTRHTLGTACREVEACDWWIMGRQNLNDLLHAALFTMLICSFRVSSPTCWIWSITPGSRVRFSSTAVCRRGFHRQSDLAFTSHEID